jgi:hypothetical protein
MMPAILYRCPNTGYQVQGWVEDDLVAADISYTAISCLACGRLHLVNPKTGKTPSDNSE